MPEKLVFGGISGAMMVLLIGLTGLTAYLYVTSERMETPTSTDMLIDDIRRGSLRIVDLTHPFHPGIPHRDNLGDQVTEPLFSHRPGVGSLGDGANLDRYTLVGQWGTHVDAPVHFVDGLRTLDDIPFSEMIAPLVVIDVHGQVTQNPDYTVTLEDIGDWEREHGPIPTGAFVALRTDWHKRWPDGDQFFNPDAQGVNHYPGWSREVLEYLHSSRDIVAIGHETIDTDPGEVASSGAFPLELLHLSEDKYQIEMMTNLDQVPGQGATIIATWPKPRSGSGFPARVFALVPKP